MRTLLALSFCGLLTASAFLSKPAYSQVSVDLHFGPPPAPRYEVIPPSPFYGAVWTPGHYYEPRFHRYIWSSGIWERPVVYRHDIREEHPIVREEEHRIVRDERFDRDRFRDDRRDFREGRHRG